MLRLLLLLVLFATLSCSKDPPPTAPAGKRACALCDFLGDDRYTPGDSDGETASDSTASSSPDSSSSSSSDSTSSSGSVSSPTDEVVIPDAALRRYIEKVLKKRRGATITQAEMNTIESLLLGHGLGIKSLIGLEAATNLQNVAMGRNAISDLTPLANLPNLRSLYLRGNAISDLTPLVNVPHLRYLYLKGNPPLNDASINEHVPALQRRGVEVVLSPYERPFPESPFDIELVFVDDFTAEEQELWHRIARRWESAIQMDFPDYTFSGMHSMKCIGHPIDIPAGDQIDDLRIYITKFDGVLFDGQRAKGYGGPSIMLDSSSRVIAGCVGIEATPGDFHFLWNTGLHEIGHVLGIGFWRKSGMLLRLNGDVHFAGPQAIAAFNRAGGTDYQGAKVPIDRDRAHWHRNVLSGELMSREGFNEALSAITLGALSDLGYTVDFSAADPYELPSPGAAKPVADAVPFCSLEGLPPPVYVDD